MRALNGYGLTSEYNPKISDRAQEDAANSGPHWIEFRGEKNQWFGSATAEPNV